ncbi:hypothetical protein V8G54_011254 [Vigna mungo]|uniref:Enoyl-CoA hydratase/isomerase domain-containing protein n=1 Tax=Vigna mungo TaxID=3915 RepID=A0AAQ3NSG9_VIGMU
MNQRLPTKDCIVVLVTLAVEGSPSSRVCCRNTSPLAGTVQPKGEFLALTGGRLSGKEIIAAELATHFVLSEKTGELEKRLISLNLEVRLKVKIWNGRLESRSFAKLCFGLLIVVILVDVCLIDINRSRGISSQAEAQTTPDIVLDLGIVDMSWDDHLTEGSFLTVGSSDMGYSFLIRLCGYFHLLNVGIVSDLDKCDWLVVYYVGCDLSAYPWVLHLESEQCSNLNASTSDFLMMQRPAKG